MKYYMIVTKSNFVVHGQGCVKKWSTPGINYDRSAWVLNLKQFAVHLPLWGVFSGSSAGKESTQSAGDVGLIPELWRSPGEGKGYPLEYSGRENSMDYIVHGVTESQTWLSGFHFPFVGGGQLLTDIQKLKEGFSIRKLDPALEK